MTDNKVVDIYFYRNKTIELFENVTDYKIGNIRAQEIHFSDKHCRKNISIGIPFRIEERNK